MMYRYVHKPHYIMQLECLTAVPFKGIDFDRNRKHDFLLVINTPTLLRFGNTATYWQIFLDIIW